MRNLSGLVILPFLPQALAWGSLGHTTIAYIATSLVAPSTTTFFQSLLHNTSEHYLASVATWADSYRYTAAGRFSGPLHFIDAHDDPPRSCGVMMERDCGGPNKGGEGMCIVGAIKNYTDQILDPELVSWRKTVAAKFVVHFLGDIHQPLHTEGILRGGNSIPVNFTHKVVNLHHVWDTSIPEHNVGSYSLPVAHAWASNLTLAITSGAYAPLVPIWLESVEFADAEKSALKWANDANAYVCSHVLPQGVEGVKEKELAYGGYENEAWQVVQLQVAKAGVRLARWLDLVAGAVSERDEKPEL